MMTETELAELRRHVLDHPEDRAALEVYRDALLDADDPLAAYLGGPHGIGEELLPPDLARSLLGPLLGQTAWLELEDGLLRGVALDEFRVHDLRSLVGQPIWRGVRRVTLPLFPHQEGFHGVAADLVVEFLKHPFCAQLREVRGLTFAALEGLCTLDREFDFVSAIESPGGRDVSPGPARIARLELVRDDWSPPWEWSQDCEALQLAAVGPGP